jgi:hypothetical protein
MNNCSFNAPAFVAINVATQASARAAEEERRIEEHRKKHKPEIRKQIIVLEEAIERIEKDKPFFDLWTMNLIYYLISIVVLVLVAGIFDFGVFEWDPFRFFHKLAFSFGLSGEYGSPTDLVILGLLFMALLFLPVVFALVFKLIFIQFFREGRIEELKQLCNSGLSQETLRAIAGDEEDDWIYLKVKDYVEFINAFIPKRQK